MMVLRVIIYGPSSLVSFTTIRCSRDKTMNGEQSLSCFIFNYSGGESIALRRACRYRGRTPDCLFKLVFFLAECFSGMSTHGWPILKSEACEMYVEVSSSA